MVQVYPGGYVIFVDGKYCTFFAHRGDIAAQAARVGGGDEPALALQIPVVDSYNDKPETVTVHKVRYSMLSIYLNLYLFVTDCPTV